MKLDPTTKASDIAANGEFWAKVKAVMSGLAAVKRAKDTFLPKLENESAERYKLRQSVMKLTGIYPDIAESLAQRVFAEKVDLLDGAPSQLVDFVEDVDGRGNNLHVFAGDQLKDGIAYGLDVMLVTYPDDIPPDATVAQEQALGGRVRWVRYPVNSILQLETDLIEGAEQFVHVRFLEEEVITEGFKERTIQRVRQLVRDKIGEGYGPPRFAIWEKVKSATGAEEWVIVREGVIDLGYIPVVAFLTGERERGYHLTPPLQAALDLQCTLMTQESNLEFAKMMTAFPMIAGIGVTPEMDENGEPEPLAIGPGVALYAPHQGEGVTPRWEILEPSAESLRFLADDIEKTKDDLRELGRQPLTSKSGNLTRITAATAANKGNSAVSAWALDQKDALELSLHMTADWMSLDADPEVAINTDHQMDLDDDDGFAHVLSLRSTGEISRTATIHEAQRRNILDRDYDEEADLDALLDEIEDDELEGEDVEDEDDEDEDDQLA